MPNTLKMKTNSKTFNIKVTDKLLLVGLISLMFTAISLPFGATLYYSDKYNNVNNWQ